MDIVTRSIPSRLATLALASTVALFACGAPGADGAEADSARGEESAQGEESTRSSARGDEGTPASPGDEGEVVLREGAEIAVRLDQTVSTSDNSRGDAFTATVVEPVTVDGETVVAQGAKVRGTVARAGTVQTEEGEERNVIALAPETIEVDGEAVQFQAEITDMEVQERDERLTGGDVAIIGGSTAGGAILGAILGDEAGAVAGGMVGMAVSTAIVVASKDTELRVSEGTRMELTLREDLTVR